MNDLFDALRMMWRIRLFEDFVTELRTSNHIVGSVHLCTGQEALYVGACRALDLTKDLIFPTYRGHGWAIAAGTPLTAMFAELMGKEQGTNGGRGGSALLSYPSVGLYGENSIVAAGAPIATGAAMAAKFDGSSRVTVAAFGEGALNQGAMHEAMNFAYVRKAPVLFFIENNTYSELTASATMTRSDRYFDRGRSYGIPGFRVDGNDPLAVEKAVFDFVQSARDGGGPRIIEGVTQRLVGHYIGDYQTYRPRGEIEELWKYEPITRAENELRSAGYYQNEIDAARDEVQQIVSDARDAAMQMPAAVADSVEMYLYE